MEKLYFPQDLVADIFSRLPLKSLMRFKCLTKGWRFLFSNSKFIKYHSGDKIFFISPPSLYELRIGSSFEGEGSLEAVRVEYPREDLPAAILHCDGVLCLFTYTCSFYPPSSFVSKDMVTVWNPLTKEQKRLMFSVKEKSHGIGFGYDSVIDDYKTVFITGSGSGSRSIHSLRLKTGLLHTAINNVHYKFTILEYYAVPVNNCLYWIAGKKRRQMPVILCFDFERDELREETSLCGSDYLMEWSVLGLLEGFLCLASAFDNFHSDVWVMEENRVANTKSWVKLFKIPRIWNGDWFSIPVCPIAFTEGGQLMISESSTTGLCLFDLKHGSIKKIAIHGPFSASFAYQTQGFGVIPYVQNLASLGV